jgi:hypothetical protein
MVVVEAMFAGKSGGGFDRRLEEWWKTKGIRIFEKIGEIESVIVEEDSLFS